MYQRAKSLFQLFLLVVLYPLIFGECHFDKIQLPIDSLARTSVPYHSRVVTRDVQQKCRSGSWKPIRIRTHFDPQTSLTNHDKFRLHTVVEHAVQRIKQLLMVQPVVGPLFLSRSKACGGVHTYGPNRGKCANIRPGYDTEYCANKVDNFKIPRDHLMGVDVYDSYNSTPVAELSLPSGRGIEADYLLYVTTSNSDLCLHENIFAYASYCQLDQRNRPIAGLVNVCPTFLKTDHFSHSKATLAIIHEIFHALGFSSDLFPKYTECSDRGHCFPWKRAVAKDGDKSYVVLPSVVRQMQRHFNCTWEEIGAPLESSDTDLIGSHWDPLVLHYSIMSPHVSESRLMAVDPITLAVFDDMGWYRVNYSAADKYKWAYAAGCEFAKSPQCSKDSCPSFLCNLRKEANASGCDYYHTSVSVCSPVSKYHQTVGIYKPHRQGRCRNGNFRADEKEACFISFTYETREAQCMRYRCSDDELQILVDENWIACPYGSQFFIEESERNVTCPEDDRLCKRRHHAERLQYFDFVGGIAVWIPVKSPTPSAVRAINGSKDHVTSGAVAELKKETDLPLAWINRTILLEHERYIFGLLLVPPSEVSKEDVEVVYRKINHLSVHGGLNFTYITISQARRRRPISEPPWPFQNLRGVYILVFLLCVVLVAVIVAAFGASAIQKIIGRPMVTRSRRETEFVSIAR